MVAPAALVTVKHASLSRIHEGHPYVPHHILVFMDPSLPPPKRHLDRLNFFACLTSLTSRQNHMLYEVFNDWTLPQESEIQHFTLTSVFLHVSFPVSGFSAEILDGN